MIEGIILILHIAGFFAVFIPMWVLAPRSKPDVLTTFIDNGGWGNLGLSAMIALQGPLSSLIGYDCSVHMSEELSDASLKMPRAIMWAVGPNAVLGFLIAVTMVFTVGDVDEVLKTRTYQPFIQVFYNGTRSLAGTDAMCAIVILCLVSCCISEVATASRQLWSFARDNGLPASKFLAHVCSEMGRLRLYEVKANIVLGQSWLEHPATSRIRLASHNIVARLHQPGLIRCPQRDKQPGRGGDLVFVHDDHRRNDLEANMWRPLASTTLVSWTLGFTNQHCSVCIPRTTSLLRVLAAFPTGHGAKHELVVDYVRRSLNHRDHLLYCARKARLHWAG